MNEEMNEIREMRLSTGLSQKKFGDMLEIPLRTIQDWECGKRTPAPYIVKLIKFYVIKNAEES